MKKPTYYITLLIIVLFSACAQIGTLTGGEKDKDPPKFVKSNPDERGLNFSEDKISITFDEFFVLDNLKSLFLSSPPLLEKPDFNIKRKSLIVKLHEKLKDTTTYTFLFGDAIKDYHAGNKMTDFRFVFSTGDRLDTMEVSGRIIDAKTHKGQADMLVMLYNNYKDSTPITEKPYYIAKTDTSGKFNINFIKPDRYRIFALKDNDANLNFNLPSEKIAFIDSFIIPKVITETKIDSLKAGTILHKEENDTIGDTLITDTVIITQKYNYSPKNILLFSFTEDYQSQYLVNIERNSKGHCVFQYNKNTKDLNVTGLGFILNSTNSFTERQDSGRIVSLWLKDKNLYQKDTLRFKLSYFNKDSLGNSILEQDTAVLSFNSDADTLKKYVLFLDSKVEIDSVKDFEIETETPLLSTDTNHIKLFELLDTLVTDTKKQALEKYFRPAPNTLIFNLRRPYVHTFYLEALNFDTVPGWYSKIQSQKDTLLTCEITQNEISQKDSLKFILHYDNAYFKGQIQHFSDTLTLPLLKQNLISAARPSPDTLIFNFKKQISPETSVEIADNNSDNWYHRLNSENKTQLILKITNKNRIEEDTLMLKIRTLDFDNTQGDKIYFEYLKNVVFKHKRQKIIKAFRPGKNQISLFFNKPLDVDIKVSATDSLINTNAFKIKYNKTKDTVNCEILNQNFYINDTISIIVSYTERIKQKDIDHNDTISLIYKKKRRKHKRHYKEKTTDVNKETVQDVNGEKKETVSIEILTDYSTYPDSVNKRKIHIKHKWKDGTSYVLKLDSFALEDYYSDFSPSKEFKFKVRSKEDYGRIILNISNIKKISNPDFYTLNDTTSVDSATYSVLPKGQLILNLYDKDNTILKTEYLKKDTILTYENIISGNYHLELIYDENENKIWDTGNYLKNRQPERILYYPDDIIVKPNWDNSVDIKIKAQKYN
ncbi:MAG: hypothetical protein DRI94_00075 [Bacteroidetes bacterium]|nr:MAG: hypothetical protein DRI94_00075 [Bacteroidota bacterium]